MGEVYRATDAKLGRDVALKVLPAEMASRPERLERFRREAKALAALDHPGIHFLTMQLVEGQPLDRLIPAGGMRLDLLRDAALGLADALAAAHDKGIVHRDLKPSNVMATAEGRVKVLDFGLSRISAAADRDSSGSQLPTDLHTREGVVMGTVPYMSPEQVAGREVDHRSDLFSLGVMLYEMATGQRPFRGDSSAEVASAILRDAPAPRWPQPSASRCPTSSRLTPFRPRRPGASAGRTKRASRSSPWRGSSRTTITSSHDSGTSGRSGAPTAGRACFRASPRPRRWPPPRAARRAAPPTRALRTASRSPSCRSPT